MVAIYSLRDSLHIKTVARFASTYTYRGSCYKQFTHTKRALYIFVNRVTFAFDGTRFAKYIQSPLYYINGLIFYTLTVSTFSPKVF